MTEEKKVEKQKPEKKVEKPVEKEKQKPTEKKENLTLEELREENKNLKAANKAANSEAATRRRKLEAFETAENDRKEAEMSEIELLNKKRDELEAENKKLKLSSQQHSIAEKVGLPIAFAKRIHGNSLEEMEADAQALFDDLPVKPKIDPGPTNPGVKGGKKVETDAQKRERLL